MVVPSAVEARFSRAQKALSLGPCYTVIIDRGGKMDVYSVRGNDFIVNISYFPAPISIPIASFGDIFLKGVKINGPARRRLGLY